jgi:hypothetical protein
MNINEQMNQLGKIGSVGYAPTDALIDGLLAKTKRARAVRQGSAAVVGSVSAVALGVIGTQVYVTIHHRNDAATQDRNIENGLPGIFDFDGKYGGGYNGMDSDTRADLDKIYADLRAAAAIDAKHLAEQQAAAEAAAAAAAASAAAAAGTPGTAHTGTTTGAACVYETHEWNGGTKYRSPETNCEWVYPEEPPATGTPAGWIDFGGDLGQCKNYYDAATGTTVWAAFIDAGSSYKKIVLCEGGPTDYWSGNYHYVYNGPKGSGWHADVSGTTCTGYTTTIKGAPYQYSCNPNKEYWIFTNSNFKFLAEKNYYYDITQSGTWPANWTWCGSAWVYTEPTTPPDPTPAPSVTPPPA